MTAFFSYRGYVRAVENAEHGYSAWALAKQPVRGAACRGKSDGPAHALFRAGPRRGAECRRCCKHVFCRRRQQPRAWQIERSGDAGDELEAIRAAFRTEAERSGAGALSGKRGWPSISGWPSAIWRVPRFASMFVTDRHGTQLASAFDDKSVSLSIGKNWAYRTYFHGGADEMPPFDRPPKDPPHIERTHLSAVFFSSTQKTWKVAISTPIYRARRRRASRQFDGHARADVDLGDFQLPLAASGKRDHEQFLVLVDARPGPDQGIILHHPLFEEMDARGQRGARRNC